MTENFQSSIKSAVQADHENVAKRKSLTGLVHEFLRTTITPGDTVIDATAGNGHDTLFMAQCAGPSGRVLAFDVQMQAVQNTTRRLQDHGIGNTQLIHRSHVEMMAAARPGTVSAITFNLGYLPGGNHAITTTASETVEAIGMATQLLRVGGVLTILCYRGHSQGPAEAEAVERTLSLLGTDVFVIQRIESSEGNPSSPLLFVVRRTS